MSPAPALIVVTWHSQKGAAVAAITKGLKPFRFAIFISGGVPVDFIALRNNKVNLLSLGSQSPYSTSIPTVNVFGATDPRKDEFGIGLSAICKANIVAEIVYGDRHETLGRKIGNIVSKIVLAINTAYNKYYKESRTRIIRR